MIKGIIFDMDGTVLNSMPMWENVDELYLRSQGVEAEQGLSDKLYTMNMEQAANYLIEHYHLERTVREVIAGIEDQVKDYYEKRVPLKNGVREFLMEFRERKLPMMVATAGERKFVDAAFKRLGIAFRNCHLHRDGDGQAQSGRVSCRRASDGFGAVPGTGVRGRVACHPDREAGGLSRCRRL